jgi:hypothetical protein
VIYQIAEVRERTEEESTGETEDPQEKRRNGDLFEENSPLLRASCDPVDPVPSVVSVYYLNRYRMPPQNW